MLKDAEGGVLGADSEQDIKALLELKQQQRLKPIWIHNTVGEEEEEEEESLWFSMSLKPDRSERNCWRGGGGGGGRCPETVGRSGDVFLLPAVI